MGRKFKDLRGQKFGALTPVEFVSGPPSKWVCKCDCGKEKTVLQSNLVQGMAKSCGCLQYENRPKKHGLTGTSLYRRWSNARQTGEVCKEWKDDFLSFHDWAKDNGFEEGLYLTRLHNSRPYSPDNCLFTTANHVDRSHAREIAFYDHPEEDDTEYDFPSISSAARKLGVSRATVLRKLKDGTRLRGFLVKETKGRILA